MANFGIINTGLNFLYDKRAVDEQLTAEVYIMQEFLNFITNNLVAIIGGLIVIILLFLSFIKVPPNTIIVISGVKKEPRIVSGRVGFKIPFFERKDKLLLKQMIIEIETASEVATSDYIEIQLSAVVKTKISEEAQMLALATKNFLNQTPEQTISDLKIPLQAVLTEVASSLTFAEIMTQREKFAEILQQRAEKDLQDFGVEVNSCVLNNVTEETGLIKALGMEHTVEIRKQAATLEAEAQREIATKQTLEQQATQDLQNEAEAKTLKQNAELALQQSQLDKEVELQKIADLREVAERENELKLQEVALQKEQETKRAEAELVFEETTITKKMEFEKMQADAERAREEEKLKLQEKTAQIKNQILEAESKKAAEIEAYKQQQIADANTYIASKAAEAQKIQVETTNYILEREAETAKLRDSIQKQEAKTKQFLKEQDALAQKLQAETDAYILEQEANVSKVTGLAEVEVIKAQGIAQAHTCKLKAEAMKDYNQAAIIEMVVSSIPDIAQSVVNNDGDGADVVETMNKVQELVNAATGVNLKELAAEVPLTVENEPTNDNGEGARQLPPNHPKASAPTNPVTPPRKKNQKLV